jgi:hypothetical protein
MCCTVRFDEFIVVPARKAVNVGSFSGCVCSINAIPKIAPVISFSQMSDEWTQV